MQVVSSTSLPCSSVLWRSPAKGWTLTVLCKATFALAPGESKLAERQEAINDRDDHWDDDDARSLRAPNDLIPFKARADVMLVGAAYAPQQMPVASLVTRMIVGEIDKSIEVTQDRWIRLDGTMLEGQRFARMPLVYERAAGGPDTSNPVGVRPGVADGMGRVRLPNLLRPGQVLRSAADPLEPIGYGPLAPAWPGRRERLGQLAAGFSAARWYEAPLPDELDPAFFNAAPRDQQLDYLPPNARVVLENLHPSVPRLVTSLPGLLPAAIVEGRQGGPQTLLMHGDTLWIDTERLICTLTFRARISLRQPDEQGRVVLTMQPSSPAPVSIEPDPTFDGDDEEGTNSFTVLNPPALPGEAPREGQPRYAGLPFRPGSPGGGAPDSAADLRARNVGLPFMGAGGAPAEPLAPPPPVEGSRSAPPPSGDVRQQYHTMVFPQSGGQPASAAPAAPAAPRPAAPIAPAPAPAPPLARAPVAMPPRAAPVAAPPMAPPVAAPPMAPPAAAPPMAPPVAAPPMAPAMVPAMSPPPLASSLVGSPAPAPAPLSPPASEPGSGRGAPLPPPAWVPSASAGWSSAPLPAEPAARPAHDARAALGGLSAASDAAAAATPGEAAAATAPAPRPRLPPPSEYVDLLWFDDHAAARIRQQAGWGEHLREPARPTEWLTGEAAEAEPQAARDRRDVARALVRVPTLDAAGVARALEEAIDEDGILTRPLVVMAGDLTMIFDPIEALKATIQVASQLAAADKRLKEALDAASEVAQAPRAAAGPLVDGATTRVKQAFAQVNRTLPADYLDTTVQRILLEERRYLRRTVLGGPRLCGQLAAGGGAPVPTYLPEQLADKLPLFPKFRVRVVAEPHAQQDPAESEPLALLALALGRAVPVPGARGGRS